MLKKIGIIILTIMFALNQDKLIMEMEKELVYRKNNDNNEKTHQRSVNITKR